MPIDMMRHGTDQVEDKAKSSPQSVYLCGQAGGRVYDRRRSQARREISIPVP
jgi:hypothetical protein